MKDDLETRARAALHEYLIWLRERGDTSEENVRLSRARNRRRRRGDSTIPERSFDLAGAGQETARARLGIDAWEKRRLRTWARHGRLAPDGRLRVSEGPPPPWTIGRVRRAFSHLKLLDTLAVLIHLDGIIEEDYMEGHRNIRLVLEEMVDIAIKRSIPKELDAIFGRVLEDIREDRVPEQRTALGRGGKATCSTCKQPGHTKRTCGRGLPPKAAEPEAEVAA